MHRCWRKLYVKETFHLQGEYNLIIYNCCYDLKELERRYYKRLFFSMDSAESNSHHLTWTLFKKENACADSEIEYFQNVTEWSTIVLLYQMYSVMLLFILKIYHLCNIFEILVVIAIPKFDKVPNLTKDLQNTSQNLLRSCKPPITSFKVSYKILSGTCKFLARS